MNLWWMGGVILGITILCLWAFNSMIALRTRAEAAFSDIDTQLKKRHDLIPDLVAVAQGYMKHESDVLVKVSTLRSASLNNKSILSRVVDEQNISSALNNFFILAEQYPDLKAATQFIKLQSSLVVIEDHISNARRYYNAVVRDFNSLIRAFPISIIAHLGRFSPLPFFTMDAQEKAAPSITL